MRWGPPGSFSALWNWAKNGFWSAWKGTNTGFDQSINAATSNDVPTSIVTETVGVTATAALVEAADTLSGDGVVIETRTGTANLLEADDLLSSSGVVVVTGTGTAVEGPDAAGAESNATPCARMS